MKGGRNGRRPTTSTPVFWIGGLRANVGPSERGRKEDKTAGRDRGKGKTWPTDVDRPGRTGERGNAETSNVDALGKRKTPERPGFETGVFKLGVLFPMQFEQTSGRYKKLFQFEKIGRRKGFENPTERPPLIRQRQTV